jgi:SEC-C motif
MIPTPDSISADVLDLCDRINPGVKPEYIIITPEEGCAANNCFDCVRQKVARNGGRIQFGWSIWKWPRVCVQAEHHAVYEPASGPPWLDITPSQGLEVIRRLFLPDDRAVYDFGNEGTRRDNKRLALNNDPLIKEFFAAAEKRVAILNSIPGKGSIVIDGDTARRLSAAEEEKKRLVYSLGMKYTSQNALCFCSSGKKFKRCHGQK